MKRQRARRTGVPALMFLTGMAVTASACSGEHPKGSPDFTTVYPVKLRLTGAVRHTLTKAEQICWTRTPYVNRGDIRFVVTEWAGGGRPALTLSVNRIKGVVSAELRQGGRTYVSTGPAGIGVDVEERRVTIGTDLTTRRTPSSAEPAATVHAAGAFGCREADPR